MDSRGGLWSLSTLSRFDHVCDSWRTMETTLIRQYGDIAAVYKAATRRSTGPGPRIAAAERDYDRA
jgi:hypothetical protein